MLGSFFRSIVYLALRCCCCCYFLLFSFVWTTQHSQHTRQYLLKPERKPVSDKDVRVESTHIYAAQAFVVSAQLICRGENHEKWRKENEFKRSFGLVGLRGMKCSQLVATAAVALSIELQRHYVHCSHKWPRAFSLYSPHTTQWNIQIQTKRLPANKKVGERFIVFIQAAEKVYNRAVAVRKYQMRQKKSEKIKTVVNVMSFRSEAVLKWLLLCQWPRPAAFGAITLRLEMMFDSDEQIPCAGYVINNGNDDDGDH